MHHNLSNSDVNFLSWVDKILSYHFHVLEQEAEATREKMKPGTLWTSHKKPWSFIFVLRRKHGIYNNNLANKPIISHLETFCRMIHGTSEPLLDVWQIELDTLNSHWMVIPINCLLMITATPSTVIKLITNQFTTYRSSCHSTYICRGIMHNFLH